MSHFSQGSLYPQPCLLSNDEINYGSAFMMQADDGTFNLLRLRQGLSLDFEIPRLFEQLVPVQNCLKSK